MRALIVEDDFGSRRLLQAIIKEVCSVDVVIDGVEALEAFQMAWKDNQPYDIIFMDIMMPNMDGQTTLRKIRELESDMGVTHKDEVSIIMTTALDDPKNVIEAFNKGGATGYIVKPIDRDTLFSQLKKFGISFNP